MSILDRISGKGRAIPARATFKITQEGREKLQEFTGDARSRILMALETHGTSNIDEICQASNLNRGQVERIIPTLAPTYIQFVSKAAFAEEEE
jgi:DNA-binding PadR family transcriptional regulator